MSVIYRLVVAPTKKEASSIGQLLGVRWPAALWSDGLQVSRLKLLDKVGQRCAKRRRAAALQD